MSTLYIRLPSWAAADSAAHWVCPFALVAHNGVIEREGTASLPELSGAAAKPQRVVLLLAACDVTLLRVQLPPLSPARLKAALPNLVEDQLLADPSGCVVVAGGLSGGLRTVAVAQRDWLDRLAKVFIASGARRISALPSQLCLPCQAGSVTAALNEQDSVIDMTLRLSEQEGIGLAIAREQHEAAAQAALQALRALAPEAPITLYVPQPALRSYQDEVKDINRISLAADRWPLWIEGAKATTLDLMAGLGAGAGSVPDWRPWRWPLALAAAVLLVNIAALNIDWYRMKGEANWLRTAMIQTYKSAYPKESVVIDPIAQMQQKIAAAKRGSGMAAVDDFMALTAAFGEAWPGTTGKPPAIAALEYRERSLFVRLKPVLSRVEGPGSEAPAQQMKTALAKRDLLLDLAPEQSGAVVWKIRGAK